MEVRQLNTLIRAAQFQSFSKAAESLGYSQSAVTVQIKALEEELGVRLFDRIGKTVSITHYGQEFIPYARDVVSAAARAVSFTVEERDLTGTLRIGTIESIMTASFGDILPLYHEHCPHVNTQLVEGDTFTVTILDEVLTYEVEKIFIVKPDELDKLAIIPTGWTPSTPTTSRWQPMPSSWILCPWCRLSLHRCSWDCWCSGS